MEKHPFLLTPKNLPNEIDRRAQWLWTIIPIRTFHVYWHNIHKRPYVAFMLRRRPFDCIFIRRDSAKKALDLLIVFHQDFLKIEAYLSMDLELFSFCQWKPWSMVMVIFVSTSKFLCHSLRAWITMIDYHSGKYGNNNKSTKIETSLNDTKQQMKNCQRCKQKSLNA